MKIKQIALALVSAVAFTPMASAAAEVSVPQDAPYTYIVGKQVRWNPCAGPITWSLSGKQKGGKIVRKRIIDITRAFSSMTTYTGFQFVRVPSGGSISIGYSTAAKSPLLAGNVAAVGGPEAYDSAAGNWWAKGSITLDSEWAEDRSRVQRTGVVFHELAHVMGLGHSNDPTSVMYAAQNVWKASAVDAEGLRNVGATMGCTPLQTW